MSKSKYRCFSYLNDSTRVSNNSSPYSIRAMSRIQNDGIMTNSNILIPEGTAYNIYNKSHLPDGSIEFSVSFDMEDRIPYSTDLHYESDDAARRDGWNV